MSALPEPGPSASAGRPEPPVLEAAHRRPPLTSRQRRRTALSALGPVLAVALVLTPFAVLGGHGLADVVAAALVYGGLLGLAGAFVYVDRVHARQCPRCGVDNERGAAACTACAYDLEQRPRFACSEHHGTYLDPGVCACGRRLQALPTARGIGHEVAVSLKFGGALLVVLLLLGTLLRVLGA